MWNIGFAKLIHETHIVRVFAQYPPDLIAGKISQVRFYSKCSRTGINQPASHNSGGCQGCQTRIFSLPPPTAFILMRYEKTVPYPPAKQEGLARIPERIDDLGGNTQIIIQGILDRGECQLAKLGVSFLVQITR